MADMCAVSEATIIIIIIILAVFLPSYRMVIRVIPSNNMCTIFTPLEYSYHMVIKDHQYIPILNMCTIFTPLGVFLPYGYQGSSVYTHTQYVHHLYPFSYHMVIMDHQYIPIHNMCTISTRC